MRNAPRPNRVSPEYALLILIGLAVYFAMILGFERTLFSPRPGRVLEDPDGFEQTIIAVITGEQEVPLWLWARLALVTPMLWVDGISAAPLLQGIYLLAYSLPVVLWAPEGRRRNALQIVLLFIPVFVSFRLAISIYAMAFCLMFMVDRRIGPWSFLWYSMAVFLSSSTMFIYMVFFPLLALGRLRNARWPIRLLLWLLYLTVVSQFTGKLYDLFERSISGEVLSTAAAADLDLSGSGSGFALALLTGNPFYTSVVSGQLDRLLLLVPSLVAAVAVVFRLWTSGNNRVLAFVAILLASMLSEGVGSYSVGIVLFILLLHARYFLRAARPRRRRGLNDPPRAMASAG